MTPLSTYFLIGSFSLARFSIEARARIRLGDPRLLVVRYQRRSDRSCVALTWWLCEFLGDFETLNGMPYSDSYSAIPVQLVCDANWHGRTPTDDMTRLPWVDSKRVYGVDWQALLQALSPDVPPRACKINLP